MVSLETPVCEFGLAAVDFSLPGTDGKQWTLSECAGENGLLVMFICNHCPYVKAVLDRIVRDTLELKALGINSVAIMSNDPSQEYFVDGMTEDLITDLAKIENLFVIARNTVFTYKNRSVVVPDVASNVPSRRATSW